MLWVRNIGAVTVQIIRYQGWREGAKGWSLQEHWVGFPWLAPTLNTKPVNKVWRGNNRKSEILADL